MQKLLVLATIACAACSNPEPPTSEGNDGATANDSAGGGDDSAGGTDTTTGSDTATATDSGGGADTTVSDTPATGGKWTSVATAKDLAVGTEAPKNPFYASLSTKVVAFGYDGSSEPTWEFDGAKWKKTLPSFPFGTVSLNGARTLTGWKDKALIFGARDAPLKVYQYEGSAWSEAAASGGRGGHKAAAWSKGIFLTGGYLDNPATIVTQKAATFDPSAKTFMPHADQPGVGLGMLLSIGSTATEILTSEGYRFDGTKWGSWTKPVWGEPSSAIGNGSEIVAIGPSNKTWILSAAGTWRDAGTAPCGSVLGAVGTQVFLFCDGSFHSVYRWEP